MSSEWKPDSWKSCEAKQQPDWPDSEALDSAISNLSTYPPLVFAGEVRSLKKHLAKVARGEAFLLQGGDCAESFHDFTANAIRDKLKVLLQMAVILTYGTKRPVVKVGRIAGQFAKPRSSPTETQNGVELPSFRGESVNDPYFSLEARVPDPRRLERAYFQSAATLNLLRAFTSGGFADLHRVHSWNQHFVAESPQGRRYAGMADQISDALQFMEVCGLTTESSPALYEVEYFTSHEALILEYEQALTRVDSLSGDYYDCSAHLLWIGERTRQLDGAHIEFLRGVKNPIGCKLGPTSTPEDAVRLCAALNPKNEAGRLVLISRMGHDRIDAALPPLLAAIKREGFQVVWSCDPMHGNTFSTPNGLKTRSVEHIFGEIKKFFDIHQAEGTYAGGIHVELTGDEVTECLGGSHQIKADDLSARYETTCDPRLNASQSMDLAFMIAEMIKGSGNLPK